MSVPRHVCAYSNGFCVCCSPSIIANVRTSALLYCCMTVQSSGGSATAMIVAMTSTGRHFDCTFSYLKVCRLLFLFQALTCKTVVIITYFGLVTHTHYARWLRVGTLLMGAYIWQRTCSFYFSLLFAAANSHCQFYWVEASCEIDC
jgi:hypothetical protein